MQYRLSVFYLFQPVSPENNPENQTPFRPKFHLNRLVA